MPAKEKNSISNQASISTVAALWKYTLQEELKMSTRTKKKHTHAHEQGEQNKQCVFICYHCRVRSGAKPHAEGAPIRRRPWQTQCSGRRCPRPLSSSLSLPSHCLDPSLPPSFSVSEASRRESKDCVICSAVRTATSAS